MKKILSILIATFLAQSAAASVSMPSPYIGLDVAHSMGSIREDASIGASHTLRNPNRLKGIAGGFHAGLFLPISTGFIGMEAHASLDDSNHEEHAIGSAIRHETTNTTTYGASMTPGLFVDGQQLFLRLGYQYSHFKYTSTDSSFANLQYNKNRPSFLMGAGIRAPLSSHFAITNAYQHAFYRSFSLNSGSNTLTLKPSGDSYWVSLEYFFLPQELKPVQHAIYDGFYAEIGLGRDMGMLDERRENSPSYIIFRPHGTNGLLARVLLGYQLSLDTPQIKVAAEVSGSLANTKYNFSSITTPSDNYEQTLDHLFSIRGRIGYLTHVSNEIFAGAGAAFAHFKKTGGEARGNNYSKWKPGIVFFIGDEVELTDRLSLALEWDYMRFRKIEPSKTTGGVLFTWKPTVERALLSLVYEF